MFIFILVEKEYEYPCLSGVEGPQVDGQKYRETKEWYFMYHVLQNLISQCKTKESANTCRILESTNTKRIVESTNTKQKCRIHQH